MAREALHHLFFAGLQEEFDLSVHTLLREMNLTMAPTLKKERDQSNRQISAQKAELRANGALMARARANNAFDLRLYAEGGCWVLQLFHNAIGYSTFSTTTTLLYTVHGTALS